MLSFVQQSLIGFPPFIIYFGLSIVLLSAFVALYVQVTPYRELRLIREGNVAAAASLSGVIVGFTLPLAHAVAQAVNVIDMLLWGMIALVVQLGSYVIVRLLVPGIVTGIPEGRLAQGMFLGAAAIAAGMLNAACMTY